MEKRSLSFLEKLEKWILILNPAYNWMQKNQIIQGLNKGLPIKTYKDKNLDWTQMREARLGLEGELDVSKYAKSNLLVEQMEEIRLGLEKGIDVSYYNNNNFDWMQMRELRIGLENDIDVSKYSKSNLSVEQMEEIRLGLEKDLDVTYYNDDNLDWTQMREIRRGLENNVDISFYENPSFTWEQMREVRLGLEQDVNIFEYLNPKASEESMRENRINQLKERLEQGESIQKPDKLKEQTVNKSTVKNKNTNLKKEEIKTREAPKEEIKLTRYDTNYIFPLIKRYKTVEAFKEGIMDEYTDKKYAGERLSMLNSKIDKLINSGYVDLTDGKYSLTDKAIERSKEVSQEFEFTTYDANVVFKHILNSGGSLSLDNLEVQLSKEYTDSKHIGKQLGYIKNRLDNNVTSGYITKSEDNIYSISEKGFEKAKEINSQKILPNESKIEELGDELEM